MSLTENVYDYIKSLHKDDEDRTKNLHVTDVTGRCPVGVVLEKSGTIKRGPEGSGKLLRFEVGHVIEEVVRKSFAAANIILPEQKERYSWEDIGMTGTPDIGIIGPELVEVKSIHPNAFRYLGEKPHPHYVEQLQTYLSKFRLENPGADGRIFYVSLDGRIKDFEVKYDQEIVDKVMARAAVLNECIKSGKRPTLPTLFIQEDGKYKLSWKASYCISDGIHETCDPVLWQALDPENAEKMIAKLEYQADKATKNGTNPNDWADQICGRSKKGIEIRDDGVTVEPIE